MIETNKTGGVIKGYLMGAKPHPLLVPDRAPQWAKLRAAYDNVRREIDEIAPDLILYFSTKWFSILGWQMQADPEPEFLHVDPEWHELGDLPYKFRMDVDFANAYVATAGARGLHARTVNFKGFPIDTATIVAQKLINPDNRYLASVVSCNIYADRAETIVLGKAAADAIAKSGKRVVAVAVTSLSNRMFTEPIDPATDHISALKDDEWNRKILEIIGQGRLEDVSQLAREFAQQAHGDQKFKAIWWLAALMGQHNRYEGRVFEYQPVWGSGQCIVGLTPSRRAAGDQEFDEDDVEYYHGDRNVLSAADGFDNPRGARPSPSASAAANQEMSTRDSVGSGGTHGYEGQLFGGDPHAGSASPWGPQSGTGFQPVSPARQTGSPSAVQTPNVRPSQSTSSARSSNGGHGLEGHATTATIQTDTAPKPVGAYPHARRVGDLLFLSGVGPRDPETNAVPGGPVRDENGNKLDYDVAAQTRATIENVKRILAAAGSSLDKVLDITVFLIDMDRDFADFNRVYAELLGTVGATRTTLSINALPTPIAVEFKVLASAV